MFFGYLIAGGFAYKRKMSICVAKTSLQNSFFDILKSGFTAKQFVIDGYVRGLNGICFMTNAKETGIDCFYEYLCRVPRGLPRGMNACLTQRVIRETRRLPYPPRSLA